MILRGARLRAGVLRAAGLLVVRDPAALPTVFFTGVAADFLATFFAAPLRAGWGPPTLPVVFFAATFLVATFVVAVFFVAIFFVAAPAFRVPTRGVACFVAALPVAVLRVAFVVLFATFPATFFAAAFFATFLAGAFFVAVLLAVLRVALRVFAVAMRCSTCETWHRDNTQDLQRR